MAKIPTRQAGEIGGGANVGGAVRQVRPVSSVSQQGLAETRQRIDNEKKALTREIRQAADFDDEINAMNLKNTISQEGKRLYNNYKSDPNPDSYETYKKELDALSSGLEPSIFKDEMYGAKTIIEADLIASQYSAKLDIEWAGKKQKEWEFSTNKRVDDLKLNMLSSNSDAEVNSFKAELDEIFIDAASSGKLIPEETIENVGDFYNNLASERIEFALAQGDSVKAALLLEQKEAELKSKGQYAKARKAVDKELDSIKKKQDDENIKQRNAIVTQYKDDIINGKEVDINELKNGLNSGKITPEDFSVITNFARKDFSGDYGFGDEIAYDTFDREILDLNEKISRNTFRDAGVSQVEGATGLMDEANAISEKLLSNSTMDKKQVNRLMDRLVKITRRTEASAEEEIRNSLGNKLRRYRSNIIRATAGAFSQALVPGSQAVTAALIEEQVRKIETADTEAEAEQIFNDAMLKTSKEFFPELAGTKSMPTNLYGRAGLITVSTQISDEPDEVVQAKSTMLIRDKSTGEQRSVPLNKWESLAEDKKALFEVVQ